MSGTSDPGSDRIRFGSRRVDAGEHPALVRGVFDSVAGRYDLMNDLMSGGLHRLWKSAVIERLEPRPGQRLLDVAGGTGDIAYRFHARGGAAIVCDASPAMARVGLDRGLDRGIVDGVSFVCGTAEALPVADESVDSCTIVFGLRNVSDRAAALAEMRRVLKYGGRFLCLEFSHVVLPLLGPLYDTYSFRILPLLGQIVTGDRDAYQYLVDSIRAFPDQETLAGEIGAAGFGTVSWRNLSGGIVALHAGWRV